MLHPKSNKGVHPSLSPTRFRPVNVRQRSDPDRVKKTAVMMAPPMEITLPALRTDSLSPHTNTTASRVRSSTMGYQSNNNSSDDEKKRIGTQEKSIPWTPGSISAPPARVRCITAPAYQQHQSSSGNEDNRRSEQQNEITLIPSKETLPLVASLPSTSTRIRSTSSTGSQSRNYNDNDTRSNRSNCNGSYSSGSNDMVDRSDRKKTRNIIVPTETIPLSGSLSSPPTRTMVRSVSTGSHEQDQMNINQKSKEISPAAGNRVRSSSSGGSQSSTNETEQKADRKMNKKSKEELVSFTIGSIPPPLPSAKVVRCHTTGHQPMDRTMMMNNVSSFTTTTTTSTETFQQWNDLLPIPSTLLRSNSANSQCSSDEEKKNNRRKQLFKHPSSDTIFHSPVIPKVDRRTKLVRQLSPLSLFSSMSQLSSSPTGGPGQKPGPTSSNKSSSNNNNGQHWMDFHHLHHGTDFKTSAERLFESNDAPQARRPNR